MILSSVLPAHAARRLAVSSPKTLLSLSQLGRAASSLMLIASYMIVARSCGYDHVTVLGYALYVILYVWAPGCMLLAAAQRRRPSVLELIALGLPLGFAAEICLFLALSAAHLRVLLPFSPVLWAVLAAIKFPRLGTVLSRPRDHGLGLGTPGACCAVAALVLAFVLTVVSQMYAGSPFVGGVLGASTHHDWIYLLSRAAEIKQRWPLQDPSMAGQPLSYHYFLLVHLASASLVTGIKLEMLGLRLFVLPLSAALIAQSLCLGRLMTRNLWGGILTSVLLLTANELSFDAGNSGSAFANEFVPWLFISPTFFFGMVYSGALILWIYRLLAADRISVAEWLVVALLAMVGTGAKGTVVPPLLLALSIWLVVEVIQTKRFPFKTAAIIAALGLGFCAVYFAVLAEWGTGAASFAPLVSMKLSRFWQGHVDGWEDGLVRNGLSPHTGHFLATMAGVVAVLVGYSGIRLLSWVAVWRWKCQPNPTLTGWLGVTAFVYFAFGNLLMLDSNAQLYLLYPVRLPQAALSAAVLLGVVARVRARVRDFGEHAQIYGRGLALLVVAGVVCALVAEGSISWWTGILLVNVTAFIAAPSKHKDQRLKKPGPGAFMWRTAPLLLVAAITLVQINDWRRHNSQGFRLWLQQPQSKTDDNVALLRVAMDWIRTHTAPDAIFVANAFSDRNLRPDSLAEVDHTTVDKYYYYSALAERRFWVEGPTYLRSQDEAARRIAAASRVFYAGAPVSLLLSEKTARPDYAIIDHTLRDGASVRLPDDRRVFENARISVYRLIPTGTRFTNDLASAKWR